MNRSNEIIIGATNTQFIDGDRSARYPKREEYVNSGIMFLNGESISRGTINKEAVNFITEQKYRDIKKGRIARNDILLTTRGNSIGDAAFVTTNDKGLINAQMLILRADNRDIYPKYLFYYITSSSLRSYILNFASGSAQPQIPIRDLKKIPIYLPKTQVQRKIAAILSAYDELIENNQRRITLLEKMAEEIYREWFVRLRFPGHEEVKKVKGLPEGWGFSPLREMFDFLEGPGIRNWQYTASGVPFINIRLISDGDIDVASANCVSENEGNGRYAHFHLQARDYVVSTSGTLGRGAIVQEYHLPLMLNTSVVRFRPKKKDHYGFMYGYLKSDTFIRQVEMYASGAAQQNFGPSHLNLMQILKPKDELLAQFEKIVIPLFDQIYAIRSATRNLQATRDALLPRLISGKLFVEHLDIQFPPGMEDRP